VQRRGNPNPQNFITRLLKVVARALASHPDPFAVLVQQDRNGHEGAGEEREERARPTDSKVAVRGPSKEGESCAKHGTDKPVSG